MVPTPPLTEPFRWPPRHAPGYPPGCPDSGDVLARIAETPPAGPVTLAVVTSALRATVEESADHERGLDRVRHALAEVGRAVGARWHPSYYGKDLVLVHPGGAPAPALDRYTGGTGVRHGWAWTRLLPAGGAEARREALLRACYAVAMAARARRDRPGVLPEDADGALVRVPGLFSVRETASLLAGVLVRPHGAGSTAPGAGPGEDPRLPGVPSADEPDTLPAAGVLLVTDVHDIEWGTRSRPGGGLLTEGNAERLLPLAREWHTRALPPAAVLARAHPLRLARESLLADHLRALSDGVAGRGRLRATLGDGLSGTVADLATARSAVTAANRLTTGRMATGAGAAPLDGRAPAPALAARRARFALHVTKTLKGTPHPSAALHPFGTPLTPEAARAALAFLTTLHEAGPGTPGAHHLDHARRWRGWWRAHLPPDRAAGADARWAVVMAARPPRSARCWWASDR
ncbi:hypothetical protein ABT354_06705 [Streptomyces sp. NPDC000594]|uniref:hypothetical protein n=1 Tax=Streptomyces sp. NPDC000594 TaxID=3154261 RepID=UPI00332E1F5B